MGDDTRERSPIPTLDAVVVGAGPAGLATSRELARWGLAHVVLERSDRIGHTWANLYESLVLHTGKHLSALPGMPFPPSTPLFPTRLHFLEYLERYAQMFRLPVQTRACVERVARAADCWRVRTTDGRDLQTTAVIIATGIVANPYVAPILGRDRYQRRLIHSVEYRTPNAFGGHRVLVVGAGNSAGEIAAELAQHGAAVTISVRSGARVVPREVLGIPIQYLASVLAVLPRRTQRALTAAVARLSELARGPALLPPPRDRPCSDIPLIGFQLVDALRAARIRLLRSPVEFTERGARFDDGSEREFDDVIMATGYRPALEIMGGHVSVDGCGFARRDGRVASAELPDLYFVGQNYNPRGALRNIALDARLTARLLGKRLSRRTR